MKKSTRIINVLNGPPVTKSARKIKWGLGIHLLRTGLIALLLINFTSVICSCNQNDKAVLEAYELRIDGKVDQAKDLLANLIAEDSTNAMAHFELARTLNYMNLMGSEEADQHLKKALEYDSDNVVYAFYNAKNCFLKAYISAQKGGGDTKELVNKSCQEFIRVLELKANYPEALMYLVEFYGVLPEEMGGDKTKAEEYAKQLEKMDNFYGAKARLVMMPEGTNRIEYWENYVVQNGEDCKSLKELGVANLFNDDIDAAKKSFEKAITLDKSQNIRLLDLARYHQMKVMQNRELANEELPKSKKYIEQYLLSEPEALPPLKAYAMGMLVKAEMFMGNKEEGQKIMEEAKAIDPYFSRAFAIPSLALFEAPTIIDHSFRSFFNPY